MGTVIVNPGWFADNYMSGVLDVIAQQGTFVLPLGAGRNAPPANEDIARVIVGTLTNPAPHLGKTYWPTGPKLLTPLQIADAFGTVIGRRVRYQPASLQLVSKLARSVGIPDLQVAAILLYLEEYQRNAFGIGAPTSAVVDVTGHEPEPFETTIRRYLADTPNTKPSLLGLVRTFGKLAQALRTPGLDVQRYAQQTDVPQIPHMRFADESAEWRATHAPPTSAPLLAVSTNDE